MVHPLPDECEKDPPHLVVSVLKKYAQIQYIFYLK